MSSPAPVSLCLIVKNESRLTESLAPLRPYVKQIVVVDTGSTREEEDRLQGLHRQGLIDTLFIPPEGEFLYDGGCQHEPKCPGTPIDFAKARNVSFGLAAEPWAMWMDGDDTIEGIERLPAIVRELEGYRPYNPTPMQVFWNYEYHFEEHRDPSGAVTLGRCVWSTERERLMYDPGKFRWLDPVHEVCVLKEGLASDHHRSDLVWKHGRQRVGKDVGASTRRNWAIYQAYWKHRNPEEPVSYRMAHYTGVCMVEMGLDLDEAEAFMKKAFDLAGIDEDRLVTSKEFIRFLLSRGKYHEARPYAFAMIEAKPDWPDGYCALSKIYFEHAASRGLGDPRSRRSLERCVEFGRMGMDRARHKWVENPLERLETMTNMVQALDHLVRWQEAFEVSKRALAEFPGDAHASANTSLFDAVLKGGTVRGLLGELQSYRDRGVAVANIDQLARELGALLPPPVDAPPAPRIEPLREDGRLRVVLSTPTWMAPWSPALVFSPAWKGGGSEVAVVELSRRLSAEGHFVTVLANAKPETDEGVRWAPSLHADEPVDIFIAWRYADLLDSPEAARARVRVLWLHDVLAHSATDERLAKADCVVVLSEFHRKVVMANHPSLPAERFAIPRWGVDGTRFDRVLAEGLERNEHKIVHTSSPDRGLDILVDDWDDVRTDVPDAELHIFYGFDMWEVADPKNEKRKALRDKIRSLEGRGVFLRDRVSSDDLARELATAGVWAYPCTWPEIFCAAAVEAQMAGCRVVAMDEGALRETVLTGRLGGPSSNRETFVGGFASDVVDALLGKRAWDKIDRTRISQDARKAFSLDGVGKNWSSLFLTKLLDKLDLPKYESQR